MALNYVTPESMASGRAVGYIGVMVDLVTGANGFIGQHLAKHLAETGEGRRVIGVGMTAPDLPGVQGVALDLSETEALRELLDRERPDRVYHLAGSAQVSKLAEFFDYFEKNFLTTLSLADWLGESGGEKQLFLASSAHVYGNQTDLVTETHPVHPIGAYGYTKYLAEQGLRDKVKEFPGLKVVVGRLYNCIGPGQRLGFVVPDLCTKISKLSDGDELQVGDLSSFRHFMDVRDLIRVLPQLMDAPNALAYNVFNIASAKPVSIKDLLDKIVGISGRQPKIRASETPNAFKGLTVDTAKLQKCVGGNPFRSLDETLRDTYEWVLRQDKGDS